MNFNEDHIIDYLAGNLRPEEQRLLEEQLLNDLPLRDAIQAQQVVNQALEYQHDEDLKATFAGWSDSAKKKDSEAKVKQLSLPKKWLALAASLVVIVAAVFLLSKPSQTDQLFASYYSEPLTGVTRDAQQANPDQSYLKALDYYAAEKYTLAIGEFHKVNPDQAEYEASKLLITDSYIKMYDWASALRTSNENLKLSEASPLFLERSQWTKALLLIQDGQEESAQKLLEMIIANSDHLFNGKASALQRDIE